MCLTYVALELWDVNLISGLHDKGQPLNFYPSIRLRLEEGSIHSGSQLERWPRMRNVGCTNPSLDGSKSYKHGATAPLLNAVSVSDP